MASADEFLNEFHWVMDVLQNIDVGLVVLDEEFNVQLWNSFMQNHSARSPSDVLGKKVIQETTDGHAAEKTNKVLNEADLAPGTYLLTIKQNGAVILSTKVIKNEY